jgi:hypothetical protein
MRKIQDNRINHAQSKERERFLGCTNKETATLAQRMPFLCP